jgi:DNA-binding response OmpR family regulator
VQILLVEDNAYDVELTIKALKKGQIKNELVVARDGQQALDLLFGVGGKEKFVPGLILLDLNLPKVNGLDVLQQLKADAELRRVPVLILTASTHEEDVVRSYDLGVNTFISKPVEFEEFIKVITAIEQYWILIATLPPSGKVDEAAA